jgi:hypothetical protein
VSANTFAIESATDDERRAVMNLAIGRLFRLAARPAQPGDDKEFFEIRRIVMACSEGHEAWKPEEPVASVLTRFQAKFGDSGG